MQPPSGQLLLTSSSDVLDFFKEVADYDDEVSELLDAEGHAAFCPDAQQRDCCDRADSDETLRCFHCGLPFCRVAPAIRRSRGGARVKGYLTTRQKLLFPQAWMKAYTCECDSP